MLLFKKIRSKSVATSDAQLKIIRQWKALKERVANYLQRKSELLSVQAKKYSLIFFCFLFGGSSVAVIIHSATAETQPVSITKISKPQHSIQDEKKFLETDSSITKQEYNRIEQFKNYLFQLQTDSWGRKKFDSIMQARPQLIDSINLFEKMYLQQK
jgi:hypothetical protein